MKILFILAIGLAGVSVAEARGGGRSFGGSHYVSPHYNSNGSYTQGHFRTNPNGTQRDNWSSQGNVNPYTGQPGTKIPRY